MSPVSRRDLLVGGGSAIAGGLIGGTAVFFGTRAPAPSATPSPVPVRTASEWIARRLAPYVIGFRGAGGLLPEHTLPGYLQALEWGAECVDVAVVLSADKVLYCLQDRDLARMTTLKGDATTTTSKDLDLARVSCPRLGPRWQGANMPAVPRLTDVLQQIAGKAVLCIEPVGDNAHAALLQLLDDLKLHDTVIMKLDAGSRQLVGTQDRGYPVVATLPPDVTAASVTVVASRLNPTRDAILLPAPPSSTPLPVKLIQAAAATGIPIWASPVHRRSDASYYSRLGVQGIVAPGLPYLNGKIPPSRTDDWASGQLTPGALTKDPLSPQYALNWVNEGVITLPARGHQKFITMGQYAPIDVASYRISFDAMFDPLPSDTWQHVSISFAHVDDRYYEHRLGEGAGYHALLRADGGMSLVAHLEGDPNGRELTQPAQGTPLKAGVWARVTLDVSPASLQWARDDGTTLQAQDERFRGGYFHIGSSSEDGTLNLRNLSLA